MAQAPTLSPRSATSTRQVTNPHQVSADVADFDIRALVRETLAVSPDPDPHAIVEQVLAAIPRRAYREVIRYLLGDAVRQWSATDRNRPLSEVSERSVGPSRWSRVTSIFMDRIYLDGDDHRWEFLGKMTGEELCKVAGLRRWLAAGNIAAAMRFEKLAELLEERSLTTVEELAEAEVRAVMAS